MKKIKKKKKILKQKRKTKLKSLPKKTATQNTFRTNNAENKCA